MDSVESDLVEPIHAESFFSVALSGEIHERLCFEYVDEGGYYGRVLSNDELLQEEILKLSTNMQLFLDEERVEINGERVRSIVSYTDIFLKGESNVVAIVYLIDFAGRFADSRNEIETWVEEEMAPYDFEIIWRFPVGTSILEVETKLEHEVYGDIITLWSFEGEEVGGYEKMVFEMPAAALSTREST